MPPLKTPQPVLPYHYIHIYNVTLHWSELTVFLQIMIHFFSLQNSVLQFVMQIISHFLLQLNSKKLHNPPDTKLDINYFDLLGGQGPDAQVFGKEDESVVEKYLPFCGIGLKNAQLYERQRGQLRNFGVSKQLILKKLEWVIRSQKPFHSVSSLLITHSRKN